MHDTVDAPGSALLTSDLGNENMGKVVVELELINAEDETLHKHGYRKASEIRSIKIQALVDTGATGLSMSQENIEKLGLPLIKEVDSRFANGQTAKRKVYGAVLIKVMGRSAITWVVPNPTNVPALMGQVPLEQLDLMVDPKRHRLVPGHPDSPDIEVWECY
jgi:predicted aspartyl protease